MRLHSCEDLTERAGFELVHEGREKFSQSGESREKDILAERTVRAKMDLEKGKRMSCYKERGARKPEQRFPCTERAGK